MGRRGQREGGGSAGAGRRHRVPLPGEGSRALSGTASAVRCHLEVRPSGWELRGTPALESRVTFRWLWRNQEDARRLSCISGSGDWASGAPPAERRELPPEACSGLRLDPARPTHWSGLGRVLFPNFPESRLSTASPAGLGTQNVGSIGPLCGYQNPLRGDATV